MNTHRDLVCAMVAAVVVVIGATPAAMRAQPTRTPNPNAPRMLVGMLRSSDRMLSLTASDTIRDRLARDIPGRMLTVISSADYKTVVEVGYDEALTTGDLASLAKLLRTDEFIDGSIARTATGFLINARLTLTRDVTLTQPLPPAEGDQLGKAASALSKHVMDARKQMEFEKSCNALWRSGKLTDAIAAARQGVAVYPRATLARLCELQVRVGAKQAPDSIIAIAQEIISIDPQSQRALRYAAQAYREKGDQQRANEMLFQLLATDPTDTRIVVDVVNALVATRQWDTATPIIAQAIKDNPGDVRMLRLGFLVYMMSGDRQRGIAAGEDMVMMDTSLADSAYFMRLIIAYRSDSAYAKAAEVSQRAVGKLPRVLVFWTELGDALRRSGQLPKAMATYRRLLYHDPKAPVRVQLAQLYDDAHQPDSAFIILREAKAVGEDGQLVGQQAFLFGSALVKSGSAAYAKAGASQAAAAHASAGARTQSMRAAAEDRTVAISELLRAISWMSFADSAYTDAEDRNTAGFFTAVAAYYVSNLAQAEAAAAKAAEPSGSKACECARLFQRSISLAQSNIARGGRANRPAVEQLQGPIAAGMSGSGKVVDAYCRKP